MFIIVFYHVFVHVRMFDQVIGTIISGGVGNVMKGVLNLSKAITCLNLLLVRTGTRCRSRRIIDK